MLIKLLLYLFLKDLVVEGGMTNEEQIMQAKKICSTYGYKIVNARFASESHVLCLKLKSVGSLPFTNHKTKLIIDPDLDDDNHVETLSLADVTMAYGFPVENPAAGSAEGYIGYDRQFYGVLHLGNRTLHADPYGKDDLRRTFGHFEDDSMKVRPRRDNAQTQSSQFSPVFDLKRQLIQAPVGARSPFNALHKVRTEERRGRGTRTHNSRDPPRSFRSMEFLERLPFFPYHIEEHKPSPGIARARICDLLLLADKHFFEKDAHASLNHAVRRMMHAVAQADIIFRNADFDEDGMPDNIGFSVKYILVLTSAETNDRVFGDLVPEPDIDGRSYLMRFARLRRLSEVCLGVAFSGYAFRNRTLGLSFTSLGGGMGGAAGGLCDRRAYGRSFNTLAIAHATTEEKERVPERIAALTLAHEMGHSFGAHHDDNFPNPECRGFLMSAQSTTGENSMHFEFSVCSKRRIAATLSSMSYCLTEEDRPYCGNGIVEEGEACDCGLPSRCSLSDPCCTPRAGGALVFDEGTLHREGCSVAPSAMCHPSQGLCCNSKCQYMDLSNYGIDCKNQEQECSCVNSTTLCKCGLGGRCLADGTCHAAECAVLGLRDCQCGKMGSGGLGYHICGVCCLLPQKEHGEARCVGADMAATQVLGNSTLWPVEWPISEKGQNVTMTICNKNFCRKVALRAWMEGGPCVTQNTVGICTARGICKRRYVTPRSNVYPDIMHIKHILQSKSSLGSKLSPNTLQLLIIVIINVK